MSSHEQRSIGDTMSTNIRCIVRAAVVGLAAWGCSTAALGAEPTKLTLGMSGWTGFAPLTLADKAGIFKKNGLEVDLRMVPQKDRHLAIASGAVQCAATTVETHVTWNANGIPIVQIFQMDKSYGADGLAVRNDINSFEELRGKTIGVSAPGTAPYFGLAWMLSKNGMSMKDIRPAMLEPGPAAQAFVSGQNDGAFAYEPYLSTIRQNPDAGKILATTIDYPMVIDTVGCTPAWLNENPQAAKALADSYFEALELIKSDPDYAYKTMGAEVKQTGEQFAQSAGYIRWQDRDANRAFFDGEIVNFMTEAQEILLEAGLIRKAPENLEALYDVQFIQ